MPWNLKNVALDPAYAGKRRIAAKMDMEPVIAGKRIRLRQQVTISDELYEINKVRIDTCVKHGVLTAASSSPDKKAAPVAAPEPELEPELEPVPEPEEKEPSDSVEEPVASQESEEDPTASEEVPEVETLGAGWYVIKLEGVEVGKVRGKNSLHKWMTENGYPIPEDI